MVALAAPGTLGLLACLTIAVPCAAQVRPAAADSVKPAANQHARWVWPGVAAGLAVTAVGDQRLARFAAAHHNRAMDDLARAMDPFGRAGILVPALAASVVVPRVLGQRKLSDAMLRVGLAYGAADAVESVLKPLVGRHRPSGGGGPWRFHPLSNQESWHSFPSAHTVHSFALATGLAAESGRPWVAVPAFGVATLVGMQRVYTGAHWGSDVVASGVLAVVVAGTTDRMLRHRGLRPLLRPIARSAEAESLHGSSEATQFSRLRVEIAPGVIGASWEF